MKKIMRILVWPLQLFLDSLQFTLMIQAAQSYILKHILFPNPNFNHYWRPEIAEKWRETKGFFFSFFF